MESAKAEHVGNEGDRRLYVLTLRSPEDFPSAIDLGSRRFICLLAWDSQNASVDSVARLAKTVLTSGGVYICAWGAGCERVHDIFDEVRVEAAPPADGDAVIMTTWHDDEPLSEAIWFALFSAWPDDGYSEGCDAVLGVSIGSPRYCSEIRSAFADAKRFSAEVMGDSQ